MSFLEKQESMPQWVIQNVACVFTLPLPTFGGLRRVYLARATQGRTLHILTYNTAGNAGLKPCVYLSSE